MDSTLQIGHKRPVEQDALRLLTIVYLLGEPGEPEGLDDRQWFIDTESQLQHLDHLVRHPIDLAYLLMDLVETRQPELDERLPELADRVRRLLATPSQGRRRRALLRPFEPGSWVRWDDPLAYLSCRDLLQIRPLPSGDLRFRLTDRGATWLESTVYPTATSLAPYRERCDLLRGTLPPALLRPRGKATLGDYLRETHQRLEEYRLDEQIQLEEDMLARLFQATFRESL